MEMEDAREGMIVKDNGGACSFMSRAVTKTVG